MDAARLSRGKPKVSRAFRKSSRDGGRFVQAIPLPKTRGGWLFAVLWAVALVVLTVSCRSARTRGNRPAAPPVDAVSTPYGVQPAARWQETCYPEVRATIPQVPDAEMIGDDQLCATCHETYVKHHLTSIHREQSCETCHGPGSQHIRTRGQEPGLIRSFKRMSPAESSETCLQCHENNACDPGALWRSSAHANAGVSCINCHKGHYNVPAGTPAVELGQVTSPENPVRLVRLPEVAQEAPIDMAAIRAASQAMGAVAPQVCYQCHGDLARQQDIAHSHQICGAAGFNCTTCHDPHGRIRTETRGAMCLKCHDSSSPTMAWHSSTHANYGVACVDCHNPHPNTYVQRVVEIQHTNIRRPPRLPMSVDDPNVCYKCHADMYAKNAMPSHHPIKEGKMTCSDCHDAHGQSLGQLKDQTVNMVCYRCHAEKQGPFAYEHPPVTENCTICHDPHGTVANNLLVQQPPFLCLRCHTGHRKGPNFHDATLMQDVGLDPSQQPAYYTDCTQCHSQIHGSDLPSPHLPHVFMR
jgi:DmsE family decaheme c-type cytochrome